MSKKLISLFIALCFLMISVTVFAQQKEIMKPGVISPAFKAKIDPAGLKIGAIESILIRVETQKLITDKDSEDLGKTMYEYAEAMKAALDEALKDAEEAAKSKGEKGSTESLKSFEDTAKAHEARLKGIERKTKAIEGQLKMGTIRLDKPLLQKMAPVEMKEFRKFLSPEGNRQMEKMHPDLFKPGVPMKPGASLNLIEMSQLADNVQGFCSSLPENISNFLVSPAEAALAAGCIGPCIAKKWSECFACIAGKGPDAIKAWNTFLSCWNGCGTCWKPWNWWCKAKCLAKFIVKLA